MEIKFWSSFEECENEIRPFLKCHFNNSFLNFDWLTLYWKYFYNPEKEKLILMGAYNGGELATLAFWVGHRRFAGVWEFHLLGEGLSDYLSFVGQTDSDTVSAIFDAICRKWPSAIFKLKDVSDTNPLFDLLKTNALFKKRLAFQLYECPYRILIDPPETTLSKAQKQFMGRIRSCTRRLGKMGNMECKILDFDNDRETALQYLPQLFLLHHIRHQGTMNAWCEKKNIQFLTEFLTKAETNNLLGFVLLVDDIPLSFIFGFRENQTFHEYIIAFHPSFSRFRLGQVNRNFAFEYCKDQGIHTYDFSKGNRPDKSIWAHGCHENFHYFLIRKSTLLNQWVLLWDQWFLKAKTWGRKKGINARLKKFLGKFINTLNDEDPPITNIKDGLKLSANGTSERFHLPQVLDLPMDELSQVADFLYTHVQERPVSCERRENEVFLSTSKEELKVPLPQG